MPKPSWERDGKPRPTKAEKVAHVKKQVQTREHHCHWPGCAEQVPPAMWGCKKHWFQLPKRLRDAIWAKYVPGQEARMDPSDEYLEVAWEVQKWIAENYPKDKWSCLACLGTKKNSRGGPCHPCVVMGRTSVSSIFAGTD